MWLGKRTWNPGSWQERTDRPRVLLEEPDAAALSATRVFLESEDFDVAVCCGPRGMGRRRCPLLCGEGCLLAAGADVVYTTLADVDSVGRDVVLAMRQRYPRTPVVAEIGRPKLKELGPVLDDCHVTFVPCAQQERRDAILGALPVREPEGF